MSQHITKLLKEKFEKKVIRQEGCWDWRGCKINGGYGSIRIGYPKFYAHRISWMIHYGEIPNGLCVLHKCDNPPCTNPDHLFLGTIKDNNLDAISKNRHQTLGKSGEKNHMSKLTKKQVLCIRDMVSSGAKHKDVAERYGISRSHVSTIVQHTCWSWL